VHRALGVPDHLLIVLLRVVDVALKIGTYISTKVSTNLVLSGTAEGVRN
jgi:hypothetical protein